MRYQIVASTNPYLAARDIRFNGRTSFTVSEFDSIETAKDRLETMFMEDFENAVLINDYTEFVYEYCLGSINEQADACNMTDKEYYALTKKRWAVYFERTKGSRDNFEEAGYYSLGNHYGCLFPKGSLHYEHDSRFYTVEEVSE